MAGSGEGREGDWECSGCRNRNYAFRSICNRCKQPRILVDTKTPADSKWLPRIGDWICSGCSNNNYASREQCKKCGQSKEEAAMPALAMPGASFPTYAHYFARAQGLLGLRMNYGMSANSSMQQPLGPYSNWSYGGMDKYGLQSGSNWSFGGSSNGFPYGENVSQTAVPKGWRSGDWICDCGFHNYSSREQCKKCGAPVPAKPPSSVPILAAGDLFPTLGTKRLASEEFVNEWDNKRLNAGGYGNHFLSNREPNPYLGFEKHPGSSSSQLPGIYSKYAAANFPAGPGMRLQSPQQNRIPPLIGKGAKQWRDGDWMCANCNNHNFASRSICNRCKTQKEGVVAEPVSVA